MDVGSAEPVIEGTGSVTGEQAEKNEKSLKITVNGKNLKTAVEFLAIFKYSALFKVEDGALTCKVIDPTRVAMGEARIKADSVEGNSGEIPVEIDRLLEVLKTMKETVTIETHDEKVAFRCGKMKYQLPKLDPRTFENKPPNINLNYSAEMQISGAEFKDMIAMAKKIDDVVEFTGSTVKARGDIEGLTWKLNVNEPCDENVRVKYAIEWLESFAKRIDRNDMVLFRYGTNIPCEMVLEKEGLMLKMIVAPRIDTD